MGGPIEPTERLCVPHRGWLTYRYGVNAAGTRELRIDYGLQEITFTEPHLFAFGEQLGRAPSFTGETAMAWGPGYGWHELRPLLGALLDAGILARGAPPDVPRGGGLAARRGEHR